MGFQPKDEQPEQQVPYYEDVDASMGFRGQHTEKNLERLQQEVNDAIVRLGGTPIGFMRGDWEEFNPTREGYRVAFTMHGMRGRIDVAALPCKKDWKSTREQALKMALFNLLDMLEVEYTMKKLMPYSEPLFQYIVDQRGRTMMEAFAEDVPRLTDGKGLNA